MKPVVLVFRDPDGPNDIQLYGVQAEVIDVDMGYNNLGDPLEFVGWAEGQLAVAASLPFDHPARAQLLDCVQDFVERYDHDRPERLDQLREEV